MGANRVDLAERLHSHIDVTPAGCWLWTGARDHDGYGIIKYAGRAVRVHRLLWALQNDSDVPAGLVIRHLCNTPACCNPDHLCTGTQAQNVLDRERSGHNAGAKLCADSVRAIRRAAQNGADVAHLAQAYNVTCACVRSIVRGQAWQWVDDAQTGAD